MSEYTPEDLIRLISIPGVTVEEIRLALNLPLEGFLGLVLNGPVQEEAFAEVKKAAIEAFGESASQKLMVVESNWTIEPLTRAEQEEMKAQFEQASWSNDWSSRREETGYVADQFNPIRREMWDDDYWNSLTDEQRRELGWVPNKPLQEQMDQIDDALLQSHDEVLKREYDLTYGRLTRRVEMPSGPDRIYRFNMQGVDGTIYHSEHKIQDLDNAIKARQRAMYSAPGWWEFVGPAPDLTADGQLFRDAESAMRYYDNAKQEAREEEPDDFDKTVTWVKPSEALQLEKEWIPSQEMIGGCAMSTPEVIFRTAVVVIALLGTFYGLVWLFGGW